MFKTVLIPVDIAQMDAAAASLSAARELTNREDVKTVLLYVVEQIPAFAAADVPPIVHEQVLTDAKTSLSTLAQEHGLPSKTEILVREGHPSRTILDVANDASADVIVVASHDPGLTDYLLGSTASRVVRHAHCSVLVIRNQST